MTMPPTFCASCEERIPARTDDGLCGDCRQELARIEARLAADEAARERRIEAARANEPAPAMNDEFPW